MVEWIVYYSDLKHLHQRLQHTNFLILNDKESVIVSTFFLVHPLRSIGRAKQC